MKALESRSQLLDAALASADEANRRWEDCRALVDQLRIENATLRAALEQAQLAAGQTPSLPPLPPGVGQPMPPKDDGKLPSPAEGAPSSADDGQVGSSTAGTSAPSGS